eukprot:TRINITY_DN40364_c0_g1_i1.p1 TRINITY_DN40364_c0_g1~~TRINITY_DN40364_c0_g1_i1.p1  ORF type:complete len:1645 (-),score=237.05 TRINITY_DN40364_c0_g1_i1:283-5217(-)
MSFDGWKARLDELPQAPWDILTDHARDNAATVTVAEVPLPVPLDSTDLDVLVAFCVALGTCDHGREVVWVLDSSRAGHMPLRVHLNGTLASIRNRIDADRTLLASSVEEIGVAKAGMLLCEAAPAERFAAFRAHAVCQAAFLAKIPIDSNEFVADFSACFAAASSPCLLYRSDLYDEATARSVARHVGQLVRCEPSWTTLSFEDAPAAMLDSEENELVLRTWNDTETPFDDHLCIHQLFERQARGASASDVALIPIDPTAPNWTYAQLDAAAEEVSRALGLLGVCAGGRVPVFIRRSPALVAAVYGILRAGHAYVPVDLQWPPERLEVIVDDVDALALAADDRVSIPSGCVHLPVVRVVDDPGGARVRVALEGVEANQASAKDPIVVRPGMSVYIIYTSGTTGKPKGVDVPHFGLVGRTEWLQHTWPLSSRNVVGLKTPLNFAISEWEIFWPLCYGARLALVAEDSHADSQYVAQLYERTGVTHAVFVPSLLEQLLEELEDGDLPALRLIIACGEALKSSAIRAFRLRLPHAELTNLYGPTEGSMTIVRMLGDPTERQLLRSPVGVPIENTTIVVAAGPPPDFAPSPVLVHGEVLFGGKFIATGYWNLPELTESKFLKNPHAPGQVYRTGDLGRWQSDGILEFLGRIDNQIKFNGVRIELGEIESAVASLPGVRSAVAFLSLPHLVVACVAAGGSKTREEENQFRLLLLESLRAKLPRDRLPTRFELLASIPTTDRGKVNRKQLLDDFLEREKRRQATDAQQQSEQQVLALSATEALIEEEVRNMLGVGQRLPLDVSFQDLGMSSLFMGRLTGRLRRICNLPGLPATALYRYPTISAFAASVDELKFNANEQQDTGKAELLPASAVWRGGSPTSFLSLSCSFVGIVVQALVCEFAFLPAYYILFEAYLEYGLLLTSLILTPVVCLDMFVTLLVHVALKWIIIGQRRPGNYPIFGWYYWKWWMVFTIESYIENHVSTIITDTVLYSVFLRLLGAKVGKRVRVNFANISDVDLVTIGSDARIDREATISPSRLWCGELQLKRVHIGDGAYLAHRAFCPSGTRLPPGSWVSHMETAENFSTEAPPFQKPTLGLTLLQLLVGLPVLMFAEGISDVPALLSMQAFWNFLERRLLRTKLSGSRTRIRRRRPKSVPGREGASLWTSPFGLLKKRGYTLEDKQKVLYPFVASLPWIMTFVNGFANFFCIVLVKRLLIGKFEEGPVKGNWDLFRRWLLERFTTNDSFTKFMELWINTEVLACFYRLLGANIEFGVNMDYFAVVEFDLLHVEHDVVFGSGVLFVNTVHGVSERIVLRKGACVLDHACVLGASVIPEGSLLGSFTVVAQNAKLEAMNVYTGCEDGNCIRLFTRPLLPNEKIVGERVVLCEPESGLIAQSRPPLPPSAQRQRDMEAGALRSHRSPFWFTLFNIWCVGSAFVFAPVADCVYWATILIDFEIYDAFEDSNMGEMVSVMMIGPVFWLVTLTMLGALALMKWILIGKWSVGDRPYYSWFHFRWSSLMVAFSSLDDIQDAINGTFLATLWLRCMGAKVGKRVCFFGHGFEFDLLSLGDDVCIGPDCDVTAHTVENMVMRMENVVFDDCASCLGGSVIMPGATMESGTTLMERSQVLKGEVVPSGRIFGGLPAKMLARAPWQ